jgi:hypothetical protein
MKFLIWHIWEGMRAKSELYRLRSLELHLHSGEVGIAMGKSSFLVV